MVSIPNEEYLEFLHLKVTVGFGTFLAQGYMPTTHSLGQTNHTSKVPSSLWVLDFGASNYIT